MNTHKCKQCHSIWTDTRSFSTCPNCSEKTLEAPLSSEKSIRFRLVQSRETWSLECKGNFQQTNQFEKIYWSEEPSQELLNETLNEHLKRWLEK